MMIKIPNKIHTSKVAVIVWNDVFKNIGTIANTAVTTPAITAPIITLGQVRLIPPNSFFIFDLLTFLISLLYPRPPELSSKYIAISSRPCYNQTRGGDVMKNSFELIYDVVRRIPRGKVATYGQIAMLAGNPRWSRVVGYALHVNPDPAHIPCYRVVNRLGEPSRAFAFGFFISRYNVLI